MLQIYHVPVISISGLITPTSSECVDEIIPYQGSYLVSKLAREPYIILVRPLLIDKRID